MSEQTPLHDYKIGDVVWAKFQSYPWWPSVVVPKERIPGVEEVPPNEVLVECFDNIHSFGVLELKDVKRYRSKYYRQFAKVEQEDADLVQAMKDADKFERTGKWISREGDKSNLVKDQNLQHKSKKHDNNRSDDEQHTHKTGSSSKDHQKLSRRSSRRQSDVDDQYESKSRKRGHHETKKEEKVSRHPKTEPTKEEDIQPDDKHHDKKRRKSEHKSTHLEKYKELRRSDSKDHHKKRKRSSAKKDKDNEDHSRGKKSRREDDEIVGKSAQPNKYPADESEEDIDGGHADDLEGEEEEIPRKTTETPRKPSSQQKTSDLSCSQSIDVDEKEKDQKDESPIDDAEFERALRKEEDIRKEKLKFWLEGKKKAPKNEIVCQQDDLFEKMRPLMVAIKSFQKLKSKSDSSDISAQKIEKAETEICEISGGLYELYFEASLVSLDQLAARILKKVEELRPLSIEAARAVRRVLILWIDIVAGTLNDSDDSKCKKPSPGAVVSNEAESGYRKHRESQRDEQGKESKPAVKQKSKRESVEKAKSNSSKDSSHEDQKETESKPSKDIGSERDSLSKDSSREKRRRSSDSNVEPSRSHDADTSALQVVPKKLGHSESAKPHRKSSDAETREKERHHDDEKDQDIGIPRKGKELQNKNTVGEPSPAKKEKGTLRSKAVNGAIKMNGSSSDHSSLPHNSNDANSPGSDKRTSPSKPSSKEKQEEKGKSEPESVAKRKKRIDCLTSDKSILSLKKILDPLQSEKCPLKMDDDKALDLVTCLEKAVEPALDENKDKYYACFLLIARALRSIVKKLTTGSMKENKDDPDVRAFRDVLKDNSRIKDFVKKYRHD